MPHKRDAYKPTVGNFGVNGPQLASRENYNASWDGSG